jgi:alkylation response protein AidB-like acyl-CoA dehydrogenase
MSNLLVNTRDQQFVLFEQLYIDHLLKSDAFNGFSKNDLLMVLNEAEKMAVNVVAPTLAEGDKAGCTFKDGFVSAPECFREPFRKYTEAGWLCPAASPEVGGQGLPFSIAFAIFEMVGAANYAFYMYPSLTLGAAYLIEVFGTEEQKNKYMYKLFSGEWGGTMCLTEPSAGSDVGALKTTARRLPDGKYLITGTKCFISAGDHDLTPNIVHPVLARIEGDPAGTKGISIFIVPKYRVNEDGSLGEGNDVVTGGIEHKMGIKGSATATLNFGENGQCIGELLGKEREGMMIMFQMMNESRLSVGLQGLEAASSVFERAVAYARERVQGNDILAGKDPNARAVTIIHHPDIRRKLMWMKSHVEGLRALCYYVACCMDRAKISLTTEEKEKWNGYVDLLIPVVKAYTTDKAFLICSMGMDVYGGYGFCSEYRLNSTARREDCHDL